MNIRKHPIILFWLLIAVLLVVWALEPANAPVAWVTEAKAQDIPHTFYGLLYRAQVSGAYIWVVPLHNKGEMDGTVVDLGTDFVCLEGDTYGNCILLDQISSVYFKADAMSKIMASSQR